MRDFNHTVNVLVRAYIDGTLLHNDCAACAVGNIISDSIGARVEKDPFFGGSWIRGGTEITIGWPEVFCSSRAGTGQEINPNKYVGQIRRQIDASGYAWQELAKIEKAFESAQKPLDIDSRAVEDDNDEWMFNGLMAVVDVLADIHNIDLTSKEEAKKLFVKV